MCLFMYEYILTHMMITGHAREGYFTTTYSLHSPVSYAWHEPLLVWYCTVTAPLAPFSTTDPSNHLPLKRTRTLVPTTTFIRTTCARRAVAAATCSRLRFLRPSMRHRRCKYPLAACNHSPSTTAQSLSLHRAPSQPAPVSATSGKCTQTCRRHDSGGTTKTLGKHS